MKVVVAPDKLKDSLSASEAAEAIAAGVTLADPGAEVIKLPVADGGEGTAKTLADARGGQMIGVRVAGPLGRKVEALYALLDDNATAVIEMAQASGLALVPRAGRRPLEASTEGTGGVIQDSLARGVTRIVVGIGGSATTDGGSGMARALGVRFLDARERDLAPGGAALLSLDRIDMRGLDARVAGVEVVVASDVDNPLVGPTGSARVYAAQKGATRQDIELLERALEHYAAIVECDVGVKIADLPGGGAAGGLGAGLAAFLGARLESGVGVVLDVLGFDEAAHGADLVVTAEGRLDRQTARGKAPAGVAARAFRLGIPAVILGGQIGEGADTVHDVGASAYFGLAAGPTTLSAARRGAAERLTAVAAEVVRLVLAVRAAGPSGRR